MKKYERVDEGLCTVTAVPNCTGVKTATEIVPCSKELPVIDKLELAPVAASRTVASLKVGAVRISGILNV